MAKAQDSSAPGVPAAVKPSEPAGGLKTYYGGLTEQCPLDYITVPTIPGEGAITFQKWSQKLVEGGDGMLALSTQMPGGLIRLFDDELSAILEYIHTRNIFWESKGENKRVAIVPKEGPGAQRSRRDDYEGRYEPLSRYVWLVPARQVSVLDQEATHLPKTLEEADK